MGDSASNRRYYAKNRKAILAKAAAKNKANPEKRREVQARYQRNHPEKARSSVLALYGLTLDDYETLLASQDGVCAICRKPPGKRALAVDHDHQTKRVRGLLHGSCNLALGLFKDDVLLLRAAIKYLESQSS